MDRTRRGPGSVKHSRATFGLVRLLAFVVVTACAADAQVVSPNDPPPRHAMTSYQPSTSSTPTVAATETMPPNMLALAEQRLQRCSGKSATSNSQRALDFVAFRECMKGTRLPTEPDGCALVNVSASYNAAGNTMSPGYGPWRAMDSMTFVTAILKKVRRDEGFISVDGHSLLTSDLGGAATEPLRTRIVAGSTQGSFAATIARLRIHEIDRALVDLTRQRGELSNVDPTQLIVPVYGQTTWLHDAACYVALADALVEVDAALTEMGARLSTRRDELVKAEAARQWFEGARAACGTAWSDAVCATGNDIPDEMRTKCRSECKTSIASAVDSAFTSALDACIDVGSTAGATCKVQVPSTNSLDATAISARTATCSRACTDRRACDGRCASECRGYTTGCFHACSGAVCVRKSPCAAKCKALCQGYRLGCMEACTARECGS